MSAPTRGSVSMSGPAVVLLRARDASRIVRPCRDCGRVTADLALVNLEGQRDAATAWWLPYCADAPAEPQDADDEGTVRDDVRAWIARHKVRA